jgi:DNA polymerase-3 subunit alpha
MRALERSLAPTSFDDVAALVALYRPGPMAANMHNDYADRKNNRKPITYLHPEMQEILGDTYGLMIYQESLMRVAQRFAGYSLEEADNLRKACGKKIRELMAKEREAFVSSCERTGYPKELGTRLFDIIEPFADYAFPKSHAYGYGLVAYQTAWLKVHHPVEYMAALLTSVKDDKDKTAVYLAECRAMGIPVLVPDVNLSESDFAARRVDEVEGGGGSIPFGLSAVRNVGEALVGLIVTERDKNGPFKDFYEFCDRVDPLVLNKRAVESLVKAGAFDSLGHPRKGLCMVFEQIVDRTLARRRERDLGVMSLFGDASQEGSIAFDDTRVPIPDIEFDKAERLTEEKQMLGLYISDHPLMGAEAALRRHTDCTIAEMREPAVGREGEVRIVGGVVTALSRRYTKRGDLMATFTLEDLQSAIEVFVFPKTMLEYGPLLADDAIVTIKGRLDNREDEPKLVCLEVRRPELAISGSAPVTVRLRAGLLTDSTVNQLKAILVKHPGACPVHLDLGQKTLKLPDEFSVDASNGLVGELLALLGANTVGV